MSDDPTAGTTALAAVPSLRRPSTSAQAGAHEDCARPQQSNGSDFHLRIASRTSIASLPAPSQSLDAHPGRAPSPAYIQSHLSRFESALQRDSALALASTDLSTGPGLTASEALARLRRDGPNELSRARRPALIRQLAEVLREPMFLLLFACAALYLLLGDARQAAVLASFVAIVVVVTVLQGWRTRAASVLCCRCGRANGH